jgi:hypothetical protein
MCSGLGPNLVGLDDGNRVQSLLFGHGGLDLSDERGQVGDILNAHIDGQ